MSHIFYNEEENNNNEDSIDNYKDMFIEYENNKPTLSEALTQMFNSSDIKSSQYEVEELVNDILSKCKSTIEKTFDKITKKYPYITKNDAYIICSYTCESCDSFMSPYKLLNTSLVSDNRQNRINKISKYLYILLASLRKLKRYYPNPKNNYLYRCINCKVNLAEDPFNKKYIPFKNGNIKTFWGFTSTSLNIEATYSFLKKKNKIKSGTVFSLGGDIWGYDISLFNFFREEEILLEPERKYEIIKVFPPLNDVIYVDCKILTTKLVLNNIKCNYENVINDVNN